jgi:predicted secreted protein
MRLQWHALHINGKDVDAKLVQTCRQVNPTTYKIIKNDFKKFGSAAILKATEVEECEHDFRHSTITAHLGMSSLGFQGNNGMFALSAQQRAKYKIGDGSDSVKNARAASKIYAKAGWTPWRSKLAEIGVLGAANEYVGCVPLG